MITSIHTHTTWSDGIVTPGELCAAAREYGIDVLGISDHYVLTPDNREIVWSMDLDVLPDYVAEVRALITATEAPVVTLGVEADYFPETIDELARRLAPHLFDYRIGSVHIVDGFHVDEDAESWAALCEDERNDMWRRYWVRMCEMAETGLFDIAGHLDIPKKYGFRATADLSAEITATFDAIAAAGMAIEINTAGWDKPAAEAYPTLTLLQQARQRGIPIAITADAHTPADLTRHFPQACALAREAGYNEQVWFQEREAQRIAL